MGERRGPEGGVRCKASGELHEELLVAVALVVLAYLQRKRGIAGRGEHPTPSLGFFDEMTTCSERVTPEELDARRVAYDVACKAASVKSACETHPARTRRRVGKDAERRGAERCCGEHSRRLLADSNQKETRMA
jgi:hypothetical protein